MELLRRWNDGRMSHDGSFFFALAMLQLCAVQPSVVFQYGCTPLAPANYKMTVPGDADVPVTILGNDNITCSNSFITGAGYYYGRMLGNGTLEKSIAMLETMPAQGRCFYGNPVWQRPLCTYNPIESTSFSTMFQVWIYPNENLTPEGLAFIISNDPASIQGEDRGYLGWLNSTTNDRTSGNFAVELDFLQDSAFNDPVGVHVGINNNSLTSLVTNTSLGRWVDFVQEANASPILVNTWIEYNNLEQHLKVYMSGKVLPYGLGSSDVTYLYKPTRPIISVNIDLGTLLNFYDGAYIGFSGSISMDPTAGSSNSSGGGGPFVPSTGYAIVTWTFNSDGPAPDVPRYSNGTMSNLWQNAPPPETDKQRRGNLPTAWILAITIPSVVLFLVLMLIICVLYRRNAQLAELAKKWRNDRLAALAKKYEIEEGVRALGPQKFKYKDLSVATKGFSSQQLLGRGGFGSVYKGRSRLIGAQELTEVAVKRISANSKQGPREFLAEVKIIGQVQHRNLVRLLGWCHERGELLLVYDYMPNGSLDQHLFKNTAATGQPQALTWSRRLKIVSGVATALAYLHEEWEQRVIHRDVKSSNIMLDRDFNARLGDFGLARLSDHDKQPSATACAGTYGYMAPEMAHSLKVTEKADVYSFGAVVLEVATGKRALLSKEDQSKCKVLLLVDWVWRLYSEDVLLEAGDGNLQNAFDPGEMITFLKIGLLCSHPDADERPNMREVLDTWKGSRPLPPLPITKPVPVFRPFCMDSDTTLTIDTCDKSNQSVDPQLDPLIPLPQTSEAQIGSSSMLAASALRYRSSSTTTASLPL